MALADTLAKLFAAVADEKGGKGKKAAEAPAAPIATVADRETAAQEVAAAVKAAGISSLVTDIAPCFAKASEKKAGAYIRMSGLMVFRQLAETVGSPAEPFLVSQLPFVMTQAGDRLTTMQEAAAAAASALFAILGNNVGKVVAEKLFLGMANTSTFGTKIFAMKLLVDLQSKTELGWFLPAIIPVVSECMWDTKAEVKSAAKETMMSVCQSVGNTDIENFIGVMVGAIAVPSEVPDCVHKLAATTFVQAVEAPALSIMVPLLLRGLKERSVPIQRQCVVIIDNMAKLVNHPVDAEPFIAELVPGVEKIRDNVSDPECRKVASRALDTLMGLIAQVEHERKSGALAKTPAEMQEILKNLSKEMAPKIDIATVPVEYLSGLCAPLTALGNTEAADWEAAILPQMTPYFAEDVRTKIAKQFVEQCCKAQWQAEAALEEDEDGEDLCDCTFSLAYGNKILLNTAKMHLKRGKRYGLVGGNDVGKSTLMRAISKGQLEGFPPPEILRSVYVEPDIDAELADLNIVDFVLHDPALTEKPRQEVKDALTAVSFTETMLDSPVSTLSGGWRMKLALARVMMNRPDILMLDEPTNHLDKYNKNWLEEYLVNLEGISTIAVSHDSSFLDRVATHIIHFENKKLKKYKGNLSEFVKIRPEAKSYYELKSNKLTFNFPEPGFLEGVKGKSKVLVKLEDVGFTYPGTTRKILTGVNIWVSMLSRVAVLGVNGAGKSTMIKLVTGEQIADEGEVVRHPNSRIAYVAQHAFHHIEQHLEKTPNEYVQWRFAGGEDKDNVDKKAKMLTPEEEEKMKKCFTYDGEKVQIEKILCRRQQKKSYEYEVKWVNKPHDQNSWLSRTKLDTLGFSKICARIDEKDAALQGQYAKPLTTASIVKHYNEVGLEEEFVVHTRISALSGGQKVKVVLGAAVWNNPHILILDEPTNYLDRDSLGALAGAIKEFGGGVLLVSHHLEFTSALATETWVVANGTVTPENQIDPYGKDEKIEWKPEEEMVDGAGNVLKVKQKKAVSTLSRKEKKALEKRKAERREQGLPSDSDEDDW